MKRIDSYLLVAGLIILSLILSACQSADPAQAQPEAGYNALSVTAHDCSYGGEIYSIEAINSSTVRFTLCTPDAGFPAKVAFPTFAIQDTEVLNSSGGQADAIIESGVYSGPFRVKEWNPASSLVLEPNPAYWGVPPRLQELVIRWAASSGMRQTELLAGRADLMDDFDMRSQLFRSNPIYSIYARPSLNIAYIGMNRDLPPFDNENVRLAFAKLFDREIIKSNCFPMGSLLAQQFVPTILSPGYTSMLRWHDTNLKETRELLEKAGYDFSQPLILMYTNESTAALPNPNLVAFEIQSQLKKVGIKVKFNRLTLNQVRNAVDAGEVPFYIDGFTADFPDATSFYNHNFIFNSQRFGSLYPDLVAAIEAASSTVDPAERQLKYDIVNNLIKTHAPLIPLAHANSSLAASSEVGNVIIGPISESFNLMTTPDNTLTFVQDTAPTSLWIADESSADTLRIGHLLYSTLTEYGLGGVGVEPGLAEYWSSNADMTEWTFELRYGVVFSNGAKLDANDVVATFATQWDAANPNHAGEYIYFTRFFGKFLNGK